MRKSIEFVLYYFLKFVLWFRYKIEVKGLDKLNPETLNKPGGILFLPNHAAIFVDPLAIALAVWSKFPMRPIIVEYMYYLPGVHWLMKFLKALPIPNFNTSTNSLKRKRGEKVFQSIIRDIQKGDNFLIYPSGRIKRNAREQIGGASGVHKILQEVPNTNVVLVRIKGLWGSSFSRALLGRTPPLFPTLLQGIKHVFKNLLFFTPRRRIVIEFEPAPADFPIQGSKMEFNRYLENWYNRPDRFSQQEGEYPGDSLILVSYSAWKNEIPKVYEDTLYGSAEIEKDSIPSDVRAIVLNKLVAMTEKPTEEISLDMDLSADLGLDSLDLSELGAFLQDQFRIEGVPIDALTTVHQLMAIASKQVVLKEEHEDEDHDLSLWNRVYLKESRTISEGETIPQVFLRSCQLFPNRPACADTRSGVLTYRQLKMRVLLLAEYIRSLPGEYIGILLPASTAASTTILACQLAGKIPLMINWTVGSRNLEAVIKFSNVRVVLSSWAFVDRLQNVDFSGIEEILVFLEDVRRELGLVDKLRALWRSRRSPESVIKSFGMEGVSGSHQAVLLFTSGTESLPKGVPLTHENILSSLRAALKKVEAWSDDVILGFLPPFHAFGFTISALLGLLGGVRVAYSPDPTDGKKLAQAIERWNVTITCGAPTFLKSMLRFSTPQSIRSLRLCVTGAEKAPPELFQMMRNLGKDCLYEGYGITECSPILTLNVPGEEPLGVGKALPGIDLLIVNPETYEPLSIGKQGLLLAKGPNIFHGYLNPGISSPFVTVNQEQWYKTGDLGFLDEQGRLTLSGRMKRFVKIGGEMVSLSAVEEGILHNTDQLGWPETPEEGALLAVCAEEIDSERPKLHLFTKYPASLDQVNRVLKEAGFSNLVKIASVIHLDPIPLMGSGKVHYRALDDILSTRIATKA